jgi:guanosine-3',5'-bis(diphosphate) 3'-pyrophosphohydrolase
MTWTLQEVDDFAARAHAGQLRNSGDLSAPDVPYIVHPRAVRDLLLLEHPDPALREPWVLATALLHDVLEDCEVHPDEMTAAFDSNICAAVRALSKEMRMVVDATKSDDQYWSVLGHSPLVVRQIKAADRIDNLRSCLRWPRDKLARRYLVETPMKLLPLVVEDAFLYATLADLLGQLRRTYP